MKLLFESPSWILSSLLIVAFSSAFFMTVLLLVRRRVSIDTLKKNHDVAGFTFSIIGVLYSVILGFTVVSSQERYNDVEKTILTEAFMLADLYRDASFFPEENRNTIRAHLREYVDYVVKEEWWLPTQKHLRVKSHDIMELIWDSYYDVDVSDEKMKVWYSESISKLDNFMNSTLARFFSSWDNLGAMMWTLLIVGGIITVCFMFFFGLDNIRTQMLMTGLLAGYLSFMLFLVYALDHVFTGPAGIKPVAFEQVLTLFDRWDEDAKIEETTHLNPR
ncbi:MAG: DUF4239 domain-containing protein [Verrucomicrobia bacterium]|nr:DUF4239 domain-containing protein [Verrucomicrobiota bacterium]